MRTLRIALGGALAALLALGIGCGGEGGSTAKRKTIGLSVLTLANPFFRILADNLAEEAAKHGYDVQLVSGDFDVARQRDQVADFIVGTVAAIVLTPCNSRSIGTSIDEANRAGIPVFTADIACLAEGVSVVSHIATDNYGGGRLAAKALLDVLKGTGEVAVLDHPEIESVILRTKGFCDEVEAARRERGVATKIVAIVPGGAVKDKSFKAAEDVLQAHPELDGIFAINDPSALGALAAVEKAGRADRVTIVGYDGEIEACRAIEEGKIYADVVQHPAKIGRETAKAIAAYMAGDEVPKEILIPVTLYRKEDAASDPRLK